MCKFINNAKNVFKACNHFFYDLFSCSPNRRRLVFLYLLLAILGGLLNIQNYFTCEYGPIMWGEFPLIEGLRLGLYFYLFIILLITLLAYNTFISCERATDDMVEEINSVNLAKDKADSIRQSTSVVKDYLTIGLIIISVVLACLFTTNTRLKIDTNLFLKVYAWILAFSAAVSVVMAYALLINLLYSIGKTYKEKFVKYVLYYPVSTRIFNKYNKIIENGLIRFWLGIFLIVPFVLLILEEGSYIALLILILALFGFILLTYYPYYYTRKKINELKMQTIADIISSEDFKNKKKLHDNELLIKLTQESPSQLSATGQMTFVSSIGAIVGTIISIVFK